MIKILIAVATILGAPAPTLADEIAAEAACRHYENRARFKSREAAVEFVTVLAEGCAAAQKSLAEPLGPERRAAAAFLDRLGAARAMIGRINAERVQAAAARAAAEPRLTRYARDLARDIGLVTVTGEYLILRGEGVFAALGAWVDAGADFALIAALPERAAAQ